ncbi:MAG: hypothetical protein V4623_09795, partial [Pseudomonadota bacterium]
MTGLTQATNPSAGANRDLATSVGAVDVLVAPQLNPLEPNHADFALMTPTELERNEQETLNFLDLLDSVGTGQEGRDVPELITSIRTNMGFLEGGQADSELLGKLDLLLLVAALDHFQKRIPDHLLIYAQALGKVGAMLLRVKDEFISRLSTHIELAEKWVEGVSISEISRDLFTSVKRGLKNDTKSTALDELEKLADLPNLTQLAEDFELEKECRRGGAPVVAFTLNHDEILLINRIDVHRADVHSGYLNVRAAVDMTENGSTKFGQMITLLEAALKSDLCATARGLAHCRLSIAYQLLGRFGMAEKHMQAYLTIYPEDPNIYAAMASLYWANRIYREDPTSVLFCTQKNVVSAIKYAELSIVKNPYHVQARILLAYAYAACGDMRSAIQNMRLAKQLENAEQLKSTSLEEIPGKKESLLKAFMFPGFFENIGNIQNTVNIDKPDKEKLKALSSLKPPGEKAVEQVTITRSLGLYLRPILVVQARALSDDAVVQKELVEIYYFSAASANSFMRPLQAGTKAFLEKKFSVSSGNFEEAFNAPAEYKVAHRRLLPVFYKMYFRSIIADFAEGTDKKEGKAARYFRVIRLLIEVGKNDSRLAAEYYLCLATTHLFLIRAELSEQGISPQDGEAVLPYYRSTRRHELLAFVIEPLKQAVSLDPSLVDAHRTLAGAYAAIGDMENAKYHDDIAVELERPRTYYETHIQPRIQPYVTHLPDIAAASVAVATAAYGLVHNVKTSRAQKAELKRKIEDAFTTSGTPLSKALRQLYLERILAAQAGEESRVGLYKILCSGLGNKAFATAFLLFIKDADANTARPDSLAALEPFKGALVMLKQAMRSFFSSAQGKWLPKKGHESTRYDEQLVVLLREQLTSFIEFDVVLNNLEKNQPNALNSENLSAAVAQAGLSSEELKPLISNVLKPKEAAALFKEMPFVRLTPQVEASGKSPFINFVAQFTRPAEATEATGSTEPGDFFTLTIDGRPYPYQRSAFAEAERALSTLNTQLAKPGTDLKAAQKDFLNALRSASLEVEVPQQVAALQATLSRAEQEVGAPLGSSVAVAEFARILKEPTNTALIPDAPKNRKTEAQKREAELANAATALKNAQGLALLAAEPEALANLERRFQDAKSALAELASEVDASADNAKKRWPEISQEIERLQRETPLIEATASNLNAAFESVRQAVKGKGNPPVRLLMRHFLPLYEEGALPASLSTAIDALIAHGVAPLAEGRPAQAVAHPQPENP